MVLSGPGARHRRGYTAVTSGAHERRGVSFLAGISISDAGVLMLTVETQLTQANAFKNVLLGVADIACSVVFVLYGPVRWAAVVPLALGFLAGSRVGPPLARRIPQNLLRIVVALAGLGFAVHLWLSPS